VREATCQNLQVTYSKIQLMKKLLLKLFITLCLLSTTTQLFSQEFKILSDSAKISILTCSPGTEIYALFGHSGIRVYDSQKDIDVVFNYGLFDFNQDDFVYRFVRGKTDYQVGAIATDTFLAEYLLRGSEVKESVLNLTQLEKDQMWLYLVDNIQEENKTYRYNFIFNNCATKIRDVLIQNIKGTIFCPDVTGNLTFREAVEQYTQTSPWSQFGFDICLGKGMDREASIYEKMFLPEILGKTIDQSLITHGDSTYNFVKIVNIYGEKTLENPAPFISPLTLAIILCLLVLILTIYCTLKKIEIRVFDAVVFGINALFGCLILFLILFSKHPFTYANFNIIWLNPLMGIPILFLIFKKLRKYEFFYYACVSVILVMFLFAHSVTEQDFNVAVFPFTIFYLIRSASYILRWGYRLGEERED